MQQFFKSNGIWKSAFIIFFFLLILLAIYYPVLRADPLWDDWFFIFRSRIIRDGTIANFWVWGEEGRAWPMFHTTVSIMYKIFGTNYSYYRFTNIILHSFNGVLIYHLLNKLNGRRTLLITLLYLVHPFNFFVVSWIVQIKTLMAVFFFLLSLNIFLECEKNNSKTSYWISVFFFGLSIFSKAVFAPLALLMIFYKKKLKMLPFIILCFYSASLTTWTLHIKPLINSSVVMNYVVSPAVSQDENASSVFEKQSRPMVPLKEPEKLHFLEKTAISLKNFSEYLIFTAYPWKTLLVYPDTVFNYTNLDYLLLMMTMCGIAWILTRHLEKKEYIQFVSLIFFMITLLPLCGAIYIPIFHYSNFVIYWLSVPALGLVLWLSKLRSGSLVTSVLCFALVFFSYKTITVSQESSDPVKVITASSYESPDNPLIKLILARHYFLTKEYKKSNMILINVKKNYNLENEKIDRDIEANIKAMNGEEVDTYTM